MPSGGDPRRMAETMKHNNSSDRDNDHDNDNDDTTDKTQLIVTIWRRRAVISLVLMITSSNYYCYY